MPLSQDEQKKAAVGVGFALFRRSLVPPEDARGPCPMRVPRESAFLGGGAGKTGAAGSLQGEFCRRG